jgi:hypothetical protein
MDVTAELGIADAISAAAWVSLCGVVLWQLLREFSAQPPEITELGAMLIEHESAPPHTSRGRVSTDFPIKVEADRPRGIWGGGPVREIAGAPNQRKPANTGETTDAGPHVLRAVWPVFARLRALAPTTGNRGERSRQPADRRPHRVRTSASSSLRPRTGKATPEWSGKSRARALQARIIRWHGSCQVDSAGLNSATPGVRNGRRPDLASRYREPYESSLCSLRRLGRHQVGSFGAYATAAPVKRTLTQGQPGTATLGMSRSCFVTVNVRRI